jgi:MFS family permease
MEHALVTAEFREPQTDGRPPGRPVSRRISPRVTVSVVYVIAMFMAIMDSTIVNVALPTISRDLSVPLARVDRVVVGYLVSLAVFIPAAGWLGDRFGTKRVFLAALAIFTAASALCGLAGSYGELVGFRVLQGAGGGMLTPTGMAMLYRTFPPAERVRASRILTVPTALAPALGPLAGGFLVTAASTPAPAGCARAWSQAWTRWVPITSTCTRCTGPTRPRPSARRPSRWPGWPARA